MGSGQCLDCGTWPGRCRTCSGVEAAIEQLTVCTATLIIIQELVEDTSMEQQSYTLNMLHDLQARITSIQTKLRG